MRHWFILFYDVYNQRKRFNGLNKRNNEKVILASAKFIVIIESYKKKDIFYLSVIRRL